MPEKQVNINDLSIEDLNTMALNTYRARDKASFELETAKANLHVIETELAKRLKPKEEVEPVIEINN